MATPTDQSTIATATGHLFRSTDLLRTCLTAAVRIDGENAKEDDGNRRLSMLGQSVISLAVACRAFEQSLDREATNKMHISYESKANLAAAADSTNIVSCIKLCERSGAASKTVKSLAVSAIIGGAWLETRCPRTIMTILDRLFHHSHQTEDTASGFVNPANIAIPPKNAHSHPSTVNPDTDGSCVPVDQYESAVGEYSSMSRVSNPPGPPGDTLRPEASASSFDDVGSNDVQAPDEGGLRHWSADSMSVSLNQEYQVQEGILSSTLRNRVSAQASHRRRSCITKKKHCLNETTFRNRDDTPGGIIAQVVQKISDKNADVLLKLHGGVCSPTSVIELLNTLQILRRGDVSPLPSPSMSLSVLERFQVIDRAEKTIASLALLRRLHILRLWEEHRSETVIYEGWISFDGLRDLNPSKPRRPGNPRHFEESEAARSLSRAIGSVSTSGGLDQHAIMRKAQEIRRLGKRLSQLKEEFGDGILALMSFSGIDSITQSNVLYSDSILLSLTDLEFKKLVSILGAMEGDKIRQFSAAAEPIVKCIWSGNLSRIEKFPLELCTREYVQTLETGSDELLSCFGAQNFTTQDIVEANQLTRRASQ